MSMLLQFDDVLAVLGLAVLGVALMILSRIAHRRVSKTVLQEPAVARSGHTWVCEQWLQRGHFFCTMCEESLSGGYACSSCGIRVDEAQCLRLVSTTIPCKTSAVACNARCPKHHWVLGNLESADKCAVCGRRCGTEVGLADFWCCWCLRAVHTDCKARLSADCDRGPLARSVIPPHLVRTRKAGNRQQKEAVIERMIPPDDVDGFRPLIVIFNPKSGSGAGELFARACREVLHPIQVIDATRSQLSVALGWLDTHPEVSVRCVIAGGDGTISSTLNAIDGLQNRPAISILPIGTGNDLSRLLGWGAEHDGRFKRRSLIKYLTEIQQAQEIGVDRWTVRAESTRQLGVRRSSRTVMMTNYVSIGVDAEVTLGMSHTRERMPRRLSSRLLNKALFFVFGTKDVLVRACRGLEKRISLRLDGVDIDLPEIEGLCFLNIPYWGAGVKVWGEARESEREQSVEDGVFEVFAVRSSLHIAQIQLGMAGCLRIGQGSTAELRVNGGGPPLAMQADGEPWLQHPATLTISQRGRSKMLRRRTAGDTQAPSPTPSPSTSDATTSSEDDEAPQVEANLPAAARGGGEHDAARGPLQAPSDITTTD